MASKMNDVYIDVSTEINGNLVEKSFVIKKDDFDKVYNKYRFIESFTNRDFIPYLRELLDKSIEKKDE